MPEQMITTLAGPPLAVEFCSGGSWYPGVLLGWRREPDGTCAMRVGFLVGGLRRSSWLPMADLRLPEPEPAARTPSPRAAAGPHTRPDALLLDRGPVRLPAPPQALADLTWH